MPWLRPLATNQIKKVPLRTKRLRHQFSVLLNQIRPRGPWRDKLAQGIKKLLDFLLESRSDSTSDHLLLTSVA